MTTEQIWMGVGLAVVLLAGFGGYFIGRSLGGSGKRVSELESEVERQKEEVAEYKKTVESHFDKSATLFVSMAGSYKEMFEHLSSGYEKLSEGSARELFKERVDALLVGGVSDERLLSSGEVQGATEADAQNPPDEAETPADDAKQTPEAQEASRAQPADEVPEDVPETPPNVAADAPSPDAAGEQAERERAH